ATSGGLYAAGAIAGLMPGGLLLETALMAGQGAAQPFDDFYRKTDSMSDAQLRDPQTGSTYYAGLRSAGVSEDDARKDLRQEMIVNSGYIDAALGAATGLLGPTGQYIRGGTGIVRGTVESALGLGAFAGGTNYEAQEGQISAGFKTSFDQSELVDAVL